MSDEVRALLDLARSDLAAAWRDMEADDPRHAVSHAYYAVFHSASAALGAEGRVARSHAGMRSLFNDLFVRTGRFDRTLGQTVGALMDLRHDADYHVGRIIPVPEAEAALAKAVTFVAAIEALRSDE